MPPTDPNTPEHEQSPAWQIDPYAGKPYGYPRALPISPGRDLLAGMPWWLKGIIIVGVPGAIALALTWQNAFVLTARVEQNGVAVQAIRSEVAAHDQYVHEQFRSLHETGAETNRILMAACVNNAKTEFNRDRCVGRR